jgi:hypothetical protein
MPGTCNGGGRRKRSIRRRKAPGVEIAARAALAEHIHFRGRSDQFELTAREDLLVIRGAVPSFYLKQLLQTILRNVEGVGRVRNQVVVVSANGLSSVLRQATNDVREGTVEPCETS